MKRVWRATRGKNEARRLRVRGFIPAVVYGAYKDSVSIGISPKELVHILNSKTGHNTIFNLAIQGGGPDNITCIVADFVDAPAAERIGEVEGVGGVARAATARAPAPR